jgi:hypothetical protein
MFLSPAFMPRSITPSHSSGWWSPPFDDEPALVEMKPCRVVNGALEYIAKDLGFAADPVLQGWVVSSTLAGATVGSFTGGSLADKIGRRRTFQLDAIPLLIGTLLRSLLFCLFLFFSTYVFIPELLTMKKLMIS